MIQQLRIQGIAPCALLPGEIAVDLFAGGGGASSGIEQATGISPAIAINHDEHAIRMHEANHPNTIHFCQSVHHREVHPRTLVAGMRIGLLWLSPDCRHFSRAKGSAPVSDTVRSLAWIGLRWAKFALPRIVVLENVAEFLTWGPLLPDGMPNKALAGTTFLAFVREWKRYGYQVEWRTLIAADFGAPTTRKRLFLIARRDGEPIVWPEPSHGKLGKPKPWRTAAECIDWSIPTKSIFDRKKPLAPATCRRIARGIARYVLQGKPFLVECAHGDGKSDPGARCQSLERPLSHVTKTNNHAVVTPFVSRIGQQGGNGAYSQDLAQPLSTITTKNEHLLVAPAVVQIGARHGGGDQPVDQPMNTLLTTERFALVAAWLAKHNGGTTGQPLTEPVHTLAGNINKAVVAAHLTVFRQNSRGRGLDEPMPTVTAGAGSARPAGAAHAMAVVAAFLVQYYSTGTQDQPLTEPMATIVSRARHGLVTVTIDGAEYAIVDIGMRMLEPHELAVAQGFDPSYILTGTKSQKIARIGNSVCPPVAAAVLAANLTTPIRKQVA